VKKKKNTTVTSKPPLASLNTAYRNAKGKNSHSNGESLVLPVATDTAETMLGESYAK
jgi:hypothetical protein